MQFSLGHVLAFLDQTLLNPWISIFIPVALQLFTTNKISFQSTDSSILHGWRTLPLLQSRALKLFAAGVFLRLNRALSRKALNNGVDAKFDWDNEIIVVTGGSGGIGAEAARKFASRGGSKVVVLDVLPLTYPKPSNLYYYKCDLTNFDMVQSVAAEIRKEVGDPTCVVANAGLCRGKPILEATKRDIELTFSVNNLGLLWTAKAFVPSMAAKNHGHFLIIASQTGYLATAGVVDYAATKAAAIAIYEGLQTELKHTYKAPAVRVSVINPSAVRTKMFDGIKAPSNFIMPSLSPSDVGDIIVNTIWSGTAQNLMVPAFAYISAPTRCLPDWIRVGMQDGGAEVMTKLTPHNPLD